VGGPNFLYIKKGQLKYKIKENLVRGGEKRVYKIIKASATSAVHGLKYM
jgi:hypothetical protein